MVWRHIARGVFAAGLAASVQFAAVATSLAQQPPTPAADAPQAGRGGGRGGVDPRVQQRSYTFAASNETMPYAVFVSSKVSKDRKNPLIVSLHGLGGDQNTMVRESLRSVELAEQGGYILVAPMGYNSAGWYGIPPGPPRGGGPGAPAAPGARGGGQAAANGARAAAPGGAQRGAGGGRGGGRGVTAGGTAITDAARVREASEKDVMTVLDMIRKEFNVDERRIYLTGHSMGGAGTYLPGFQVREHLGGDRPYSSRGDEYDQRSRQDPPGDQGWRSSDAGEHGGRRRGRSRGERADMGGDDEGTADELRV